MATEAHTIISRYSPQHDLEEDTLSDLSQEQIWAKGATYKAQNGYVSIRAANPPRFVPTTHPESPPQLQPEHRASEQNTAGLWYKTLCGTATSSALPPIRPLPESGPSTSLESSRLSSRPPRGTAPRKSSHSRGSDWFIQAALSSSPSSPSVSHDSPSLTLPDILSRAPPPLPSETPFVPPVRTHLGPTNKGYAMLTRNGWREGEGLGAWRTPSSDLTPNATNVPDSPPSRAGTLDTPIDLTVSSDGEFSDEDHLSIIATPSVIKSHHSPAGTVLLTPVPTFLKPDRLGIGATSGSSRNKVSTKSRTRVRLLDTSQAMLTPREQRQKQKELDHRTQLKRARGGHGKGAQAFAKAYHDEEKARRDLLAYMNK